MHWSYLIPIVTHNPREVRCYHDQHLAVRTRAVRFNPFLKIAEEGSVRTGTKSPCFSSAPHRPNLTLSLLITFRWLRRVGKKPFLSNTGKSLNTAAEEGIWMCEFQPCKGCPRPLATLLHLLDHIPSESTYEPSPFRTQQILKKCLLNKSSILRVGVIANIFLYDFVILEKKEKSLKGKLMHEAHLCLWD